MMKRVARLFPPVLLILGALTYTLGAGIARYLGFPLKFLILLLGFVALLSLQYAAFLLVEYFRLPLVPRMQDESFNQRERYRVLILQIAYAALTLSVVAILVLIINRALGISDVIFLVLAYALMMAFALPPLNLSETGYGELVQAVFMGTILPTLGFLLPFGGAGLHRLLTFITFPLTLLALAYLLIRDFPSYASDVKQARRTLLTRLTWQYAVPVHHVLIFFTFLFFSLAPLLNVPWGVVWPVFLALPFGIVQIFWLQRIASGGATFWNFLIALSTTTFGLSAYLLAMTFWIR